MGRRALFCARVALLVCAGAASADLEGDGAEAAVLRWLEGSGIKDALQQLPPEALQTLRPDIAALLRPAGDVAPVAIHGQWPGVVAPSPSTRGGSPRGDKVLGTRRLSGTNGAAAEHHAHEAIAYLIACLVLGLMTYHLLSRYHGLQIPYTVALFAEGAVLGAVHQKFGGCLWTTLANSIEMWAAIDYHVMLYTFLPCLIFGDTLSLNWCLFKRCFGQCLLLAGPGVLFGTGVTGLVARHILPYGWNWSTCFTFGSILAATDPVAVVSLLKEMGGSRGLTMQIAGESLLNDGFAIVSWTMCFRAMVGDSFEVIDVVWTFLQLALGGALFGWLMGNVTLRWLLRASDKMQEEDHVIQISLTLVCAYFTFFVAENDLKLSGVLAIVFAAVSISRAAWPLFTDFAGLLTVWHTVEFIGNTVVFFLAGIITGMSMLRKDNGVGIEDYGWLLVVYIFVILIRAMMILLLYPLLKRSGPGCNWRDAVIMSWGGLRGAVGLALAIAVDNHDGVDALVGTRILFHVSGVAGLTLLVNATTCGPLLRRLGMNCKHVAHIEMVAGLKRTLQSYIKWSYVALAATCKFSNHDALAIQTFVSSLQGCDVTANSNLLAKEMQRHLKTDSHHVDDLAKEMDNNKRRQTAMFMSWQESDGSIGSGDEEDKDDTKAQGSGTQPYTILPPITAADSSKAGPAFQPTFSAASATSGKAFGGKSSVRSVALVAWDVFENVRKLKSWDRTSRSSVNSGGLSDAEMSLLEIDSLYMKIERELFLSILQATYWSFLEDGSIPAQSQATTLLLRSVDIARIDSHLPLKDGPMLVQNLICGSGTRYDWLRKLKHFLAGMLDGDNTGFMIVPCCHGMHVFDLFALVSFMDAHEQARSLVTKFRTEGGSKLQVARKAVISESLTETRLVADILKECCVKEDLIKRVRTKQLAFRLLLQQETKVNDWLRQGAIDGSDAEELLHTAHSDLLKVLKPWPVIRNDGARPRATWVLGPEATIAAGSRLKYFSNVLATQLDSGSRPADAAELQLAAYKHTASNASSAASHTASNASSTTPCAGAPGAKLKKKRKNDMMESESADDNPSSSSASMGSFLGREPSPLSCDTGTQQELPGAVMAEDGAPEAHPGPAAMGPQEEGPRPQAMHRPPADADPRGVSPFAVVEAADSIV